MGAVLFIGDLKGDPNLENYPNPNRNEIIEPWLDECSGLLGWCSLAVVFGFRV